MTTLAWVEDCLPAAGAARRVALAAEHGLALELAHRDGTDANGTDGVDTGGGSAEMPTAVRLDQTQQAGVPVVTLQAYGMHTLHPLHRDPSVRARGAAHLADTIATASAAGVPRVLAVCGYGHDLVDDPGESCRAFFADAVELARAHAVRLVLEPLSPVRAGALTDPEDFQRLLDALAAPDVLGTVLDTGHLLDAGLDPATVLAGWRHRVDELQLRGPGSAPPPPDVPLARWLSLLNPRPSVVCVEYRTEFDGAGFARLVAHLRRELALAGAG